MDLWLESCKIAYHALRSNLLRTLLTALSVSLGAGAISLMVSLSNSGIATISSGMDRVGGRHLIFLFPKKGAQAEAKNYDRGVTREDIEALRQRVPGVAEATFLMSVKSQPIVGNGKTVDADVAIGSSFAFFTSQEILAGRSLPPDAAGQHLRVTVIGSGLAKDLFGSPEGAVDQSIVLWGHRYRVLGVTFPASQMGFNMNGIDKQRVAFFNAPVMIDDEGVPDRGFTILRDDGSVSHDLQIRIANAILLERHHGQNDFEFMDLAAMMNKFDKIFAGLQIVTGLIAAVSLLIAGAGIMNVLMASIRQRVVEIGLRRALGASAMVIRRQFLVESVALAGFGGFIGSAAGLLGAVAIGLAVSHFTPEWLIRVSIPAALVAIVAAGLSGLIFGLRPARQAARLEIVECLRGVS